MTDGAMLVAKIAAVAFVTTSMCAAGLAATPSEVLGQLRRGRLVAGALAANFLLAPFIAWGLGHIIPIEQGYATGLMIVGGAAGASVLPKLAERARGNTAFAIALMMLLVLGTVVFLPFVMPILVPGLKASPFKIAHPLITLIVLPLGVGMAIRVFRESFARRVEPYLRHTSDVVLIVFVVIVVATHFSSLLGAVGSGAILAALLFVLISGSAAYLMGPDDRPTRRVLALGTGQRNVAAALITAGASFSDQPNVVVMVLVMDVVGIITLLIAARLFRRADERAASTAAAVPMSAPSGESAIRG